MGRRDARPIAQNVQLSGAGAENKSFFASFFSKKEESSFSEEKEAKRLLFLVLCHFPCKPAAFSHRLSQDEKSAPAAQPPRVTQDL
jgi:hypothetical protein